MQEKAAVSVLSHGTGLRASAFTLLQFNGFSFTPTGHRAV